jgi:bifunctional DNA-binding transcriptional regulator/antitoxin component of YhaV-PrlF toxin-antitoxin module
MAGKKLTTNLTSNARLALPAELMRLDGLERGDEFSIERINAGAYLLSKLPRRDCVGLTDWLLSCPEKGWFEPISSEPTNQ